MLGTVLLACMILSWAAVPQKCQADEPASYGMTPVYGFDIADGTYEVRVESSSTYFRMRDAKLQVQDGEMKLTFSIYSLSYRYVYPGTGREAKAAEDREWIEREEQDGKSVFTLPVPALNESFDCAAYSIARKKWYNRKVLIDASSLPPDAVRFELPDYGRIREAMLYYQEKKETGEETEQADEALSEGAEVRAVSLDLPDGEYSIEVNMTGGSGRASISSPTLLTVTDGRARARLIWSSSYYDYMIVGGETFHNLTEDGGSSVFEIPVTAMDRGMPVIADTTAMGDPVEIEYILTFYEDSIGDKGDIPQEAAKKVLLIALAVIVLGGVLNHFVKRARRR